MNVQRYRSASNRRFTAFILAAMMLFGLWGPAIQQAEAAAGYTLTYDGNGAGGGDVPTSVTVLEDQQATVSGQSANPLTKNGYVFVGWNSKADGTGLLHVPGESITLTDDTTLYANWAQKFEGEAGTLLGDAEVENSSGASGGKHVGYMHEDGNGVKIENLSEGNYFVLRYAAANQGKIGLYINDVYKQDIVFTSTGSYQTYKDMFVYVTIHQGDSISIIYRNGNTPLNLDYFGLINALKIEVESITLNKSALALTAGQRETIAATVLPVNASNRQVEWSSSNPAVAAVDSHGKVKAVAKGTATIKAASLDDSSITATSEITVDNPPGGIPHAMEVSGGYDHYIVLMSDGTVMSMGDNDDGQLGDGTYDSSYEEPVHVLTEGDTPLTGIKAISAYEDHNLALDQDGQVWAWGSNWDGESGAADEDKLPYATKISAFADQEIQIRAIAAGGYHSLALDSEGRVWAWGDNGDGQLGIGDQGDQYIPQQVQTGDGVLEGITAISAGYYHSLALDENGRIWAWGDGYALNPYDPNNGNWSSPDWDLAKPLTADADVFTSISAGESHNLAIDSQGGVRVWGTVWDPDDGSYHFNNDPLPLGNGTLAAKAIFSAKYYESSSYITLADGSNWCWGMCLDETGSSSYKMEMDAPKIRPELQGFASLSSMDERMVGRKSDSTVWIWETYQEYGNYSTPRQSSVTDVVYASAGDDFSLVLKSDGRIYAWGYNYNGQVGNKMESENVIYNAENPGPVVDENGIAIENIAAIDAGQYHSLAITTLTGTTGGEVWAWGGNWDSQVGSYVAPYYWVNFARKIPGLTNVTAVSAGGKHSMALKSDGTVVSWGRNREYQLGGNAGSTASSPVIVYGAFPNAMTDVKAIAAGYDHSAVVKGDEGSVWVWGNGSDTKTQIYMDDTTPLLGITAIAAGNDYTIALKNDGTVWFWTTGFKAAQILTSDGPLTDIIQIAIENNHALALNSNQEVWAWGSNGYGQLGNGNYNGTSTARKITGLSGVKQVAVGYDHSFAVAQNGTLQAFGRNYSGELALLPVTVELALFQVSAFKAIDTSGGTPGGGTPGGSTPGGGTPGGGTSGSQETAPIKTTNGMITVPVGRAGETKLGEEITLSIPAGAAEQELSITVEKLLNTANLANHGEVFASPVFELLKNFTDNFKKPVKLTLKFDTSKIKEGQHASIFYYDETKKIWVEVGGQVNGDSISSEVDHFTKFAVLAVNDVKEPATPSFTDIAGHWGEVNIKQAVQQGIVNGYPDGTFKPDATVTRAEFTVMLMNALKLDGEGAPLSFNDERKIGAWARTAIAKSVKAGIVSGYSDGSFRPGANISRAELAAMVARAYGTAAQTEASTDFADDGDIPVWAKPAIALVKKSGIVSGQGGNRFAPNANATRAEAVTIILNLLKAK